MRTEKYSLRNCHVAFQVIDTLLYGYTSILELDRFFKNNIERNYINV